MSERYKAPLAFQPYFVTCTIREWADVFTRNVYRDIIVSSLKHCIDKKQLQLHAWAIMSNHVHLIVSAASEKALGGIMRDFKKYTSVEICKAIEDNQQESRRKWLLNIFSFNAKLSNKHENYTFWQEGYHPVELSTSEMVEQRLRYLHENPVRAGWVYKAEDYLYSSAAAYAGYPDDRLPLVFL
jgi:putative transposase